MNDRSVRSATKLAFYLVLAMCWVQLAAAPGQAQTPSGTGGSAPKGPVFAVRQATTLPASNAAPAGWVTLRGNTRPEASAANDRGRVSDDLGLNHLWLQLRRPPEQEQALQQFISAIHDPASPLFHQWINVEEFGSRFGAAPSDIAKVMAWLESQGFTVNYVYPNQMVIDFTGSAGQIREAFHTEIHNLLVNGKPHIANMSDPQIPEELAATVAGIVSLNDFWPHPLFHPRNPRAKYTYTGPCAPGSSEECEYNALVPADLATIYNFNPLFTAGISGQGQTIVTLEDTDLYAVSDYNTFRSVLGLSTYSGTLTTVHPGGCEDPGVNSDDVEAIADVEWAGAAAPSATIELASCANTTNFGGFIALQNLLNAPGTPLPVVSLSYGESESLDGAALNEAISSLYAQAVTEGISVFVAAGDEGAASSDAGNAYAQNGITVSGWTSTPYNVSVGGTDFADTYQNTVGTYWSNTNSLTTYESAMSYIPEIPWNDSCGSVLFADFFAQPAYFGSSLLPTYGLSGLCNNPYFQEDTNYAFITTAAGSGGPSNCATGAPDVPGVVGGTCAGNAKPLWQSGFLGNPSDGVRDIPDVSLFAGDGVWDEYYVICFTDTTNGGTPSCTITVSGTNYSIPANWAGGGGTSIASPVWAGIQALINQATGSPWGNPNPAYYALAAKEYGSSGNSTCSSNLVDKTSNSCQFYDVTAIPLLYGGSGSGGDNDLPCYGLNCYDTSTTTYGVLSTNPQYINDVFVTALGSGYTSNPTCTLSGGGGTGATCTAIAPTGVVNTINLTGDGSGYSYGANCTISGGGVTANADIATCVVTGYGTNNSVTGVTLTYFGTGYTSNPTCSISPYVSGYGSGATCTATYTPNGVWANVVNPGSGYTTTPYCQLTGGGGSGATCAAWGLNTSGGYTPAYTAGTGWDFPTGIGTPNVANLVHSFTSMTVSPSSLTFGNQSVGTTSAASPVTVTNSGTEPLSFTSIAASANFAIAASGTTCSTTTALAANNSCVINVTFTPTSTGSLTGTLTLIDNATLTVAPYGTPQTISLSGTGNAANAPVAGVSPTSLSFGNQNLNTTSTAQTVTLSNTGTVALTISSMAISGANASSFALASSGTTCSTSNTVAASGSCTINVTFTPTTTGALSATLTITDNSNNVTTSQQTVSLSGTGTAPVASVSTTSLSYGSQNLGSTSAAQTVTLNNTGNVALTISSMAISGANASSFALASSGTTCSTSSAVAAGGSCNINVTFSPATAGSLSATLTITDNSNNVTTSTQTVSLSGTGTGPVAGVSTTSLSFGSENVSTTSTPQTVTLNNTGNAALTISSIALSGANASSFALASSGTTCSTSSTVAASSSCTLNVTFTPATTGALTATLTITDNSNNAAGSQQTVSLTGTGISGVSFTPSSLTFASQNVGTPSSAQTITMTNTGTATITNIGISITGTNSGDFSQTTTCGTSLATNSSCTISVTFTPTAIGTRTASVSIADSLPGSPQTVSLTGTGTAPVAGVSTTSLGFGSQSVGTTSAAQSVTLNNTGNAALTISSIGITGANASSFAIATSGTTCSTSSTVAASGSCTLNVTFAPTTNGALSATLTITDNSNNVTTSQQTVSLSGTGTAPVVGLSVASLNFTSQPTGTTSAAQAVTLNNTGTAALTLAGIGITGTNATSFAVAATGTTCFTSSPVAAGSSCTVSVTFTPTTTGSLTATLTLTDNNNGVTGSTQMVSLTGTGVASAPVVGVSPSSLAFGNQLVGTTSAAQAVTLSNTGSASLTIASIVTTGNFAETNTCSGPVAINSSCTISVTFSPTTTGSLTGTLTLTDNNNGVTGSTQTVSLTGTGTAPVASVSPSSLSLGNQLQGTTSAAQAVTLNNTGTAPLTISGMAISGTNASSFAVATTGTTCSTSSTVAAGSSCTIDVTFTPSTTGSLTGTLTITDNSNAVAGSTQSVTLSGTGQNFSLGTASGSPTSVTVAPGASAAYTFSVTGQNGFSGSVNFTCQSGLPSGAACSFSPNPVTAGSTATSTTLTVTTTAASFSTPRSRPLPPAPPSSPGVRGLWVLALAVGAMAWVLGRRNQAGVSRWRSAMLPLAAGFLLSLALAGCGGGSSSSAPTNPGTPAGTYTLTITATAQPASGSGQVVNSLTVTLIVS